MKIVLFTAISISLFFTAGCTSLSDTGQPRSAETEMSCGKKYQYQDIYRSGEMVRYDRYTLITVKGTDAQREPLNTVIQIKLPELVKNLGDGFRYLLFGSGYSLCSQSNEPEFSAMLTRSLPVVQRQLGPVRLNEALQMVAGSAWRIQVDEVKREICFVLRDEYQNQKQTGISVSPVAASPVPVIPETPLSSPLPG